MVGKAFREGIAEGNTKALHTCHAGGLGGKPPRPVYFFFACRGCFSFVKRVVHKGNRVSCAAKFMPLRSKTKAQAYQERDILAMLSHDKVTRLLDQFETRKTLVLILELYPFLHCFVTAKPGKS